MCLAKSGATKDYRFGQKNHWLRTTWNQILNRTAGLEQTQPILYLAGPDDNDRRVAIDKGVPSHNLIAIDRDRCNIDKIKQSGCSAIQARAENVLRTWPTNRKVCGVVLDFCSGLEQRYFLDLREPLARTPFAGAVILLNFQRGRDKSSEDMRERLNRGPGFLSILRRLPQSVRFLSDMSVDNKNRAAMFMYMLTHDLAYGCLKTIGIDPTSQPKHLPEYSRLFQNALFLFKPVFISYQSGALVFDSVVFTQFHMPDGTGIQTDIEDSIDYGKDESLARRISATLAVRTRRMRS